MTVPEAFRLDGRVAVITGGAGMLGRQHAQAIAEAGGIPVLLDIHGAGLREAVRSLRDRDLAVPDGLQCDITQLDSVSETCREVLRTHGRADILINNAANNPKADDPDALDARRSRLEHFPLERWEQDIAVGLTGAMICSRVFGTGMADRGRGVILNIASDLALIAPDQRLYRVDGADPEDQPVKPVTYSVVKAGLVGLTRYLATYWAESGVRVNAICPGGVQERQDAIFLERISRLIPLGRMARPDEYNAAIVFLVSDASAYMTGAIVPMGGGRTCW
jgi:NAD(P)-dependent dehydrogenase (short-subunit alcohol dehydrogenase family)